MFISFMLCASIAVLGRERPKFAAKRIDVTQNGQAHVEEDDVGTGTIKVDRAKDAAPPLR